MRYALKKNVHLLKALDDRFKDDYELIRLLASYDANVLKYATDRITNHKQIFIERINAAPHIVAFLGDRLKSNTMFITELILKNVKAYPYIPLKFKSE